MTKKQLTLQDVAVIRERYADGAATQVELAAAFGMTQATISRVVGGRVFVANRAPRARRKRKLTSEQVQTIRYRRCTEKITLRELAVDFQLTVPEVQSIVSGKTYRDVPLSEQEKTIQREIDSKKLFVVEYLNQGREQ